MTVQLTQLAKRAGCAAKQPPGYLFSLLKHLPAITDPNVLVGSATADDAAVYQLNDEIALVLTTDFFTPVVDEPYDFGAVAAANALSDVYAMGGKPLTALNLVGFPDDKLEPEVLGEILRGGAETARRAGIDLVGGHTIKSDEPIYGLAVTGIVHPQHIISNAGAQAGDYLVLSKPLGIGILTTAAKQRRDPHAAIRKAINLMTTLNASACEAMVEVGVQAATDITGFGFLGHLRNILMASHCSATVWAGEVPVVSEAWEYVREGIAPGGTHANRRFLADWVAYDAAIDTETQLVLCDAQTSGGLLMVVSAENLERLVAGLKERETPAWSVVGQVTAGNAGRIAVVQNKIG
ncbi:MAG: selenide, water dikinase SelD [Blastocatellia bacterium]|nr:selenide, water dikinase SelD [Blastocatellia bacterium]